MFRPKFQFSKLLNCFLTIFLLFSLAGCLPSRPQPKPPADVLAAKEAKKLNAKLKLTAKSLRRKRISTSRNLYEGSLWRYESSFGNLLRDHRARFRGDLLSVNDLALIVNVPPAKIAPEGQPAGGAETANVALEAMTLRDTIEEEQNEILRNLDGVSARVIRVLPDGNMLIMGQKTDYRQRNQVRYITTVTGILRPVDINDSNIVSASKLANPNVQIKRQQSGSLVRERLQKLAPLLGKQKAGFFGRLGDLAEGTTK
ncbi:MAG: flagellar basal body L-ring protein FlgH [SAR324 cluster bacterium]|nr:flagellar basal body L-ring protein FlgH [SAR324 cluster bacterium]MBL7035298.1 flagellar basal body L-ring protein FlgH [SAR324 cluster bacterium]